MESNTLRTLLAIVLSMAVLIVWQMWFAPKPPVPQRPDVSHQAASDVAKPAATAPSAADGGMPAAPTAEKKVPASEKVPSKPRAEEKLYVVENDLWQAVFSDRGATLKSFKLRKYRVATKDPRPVDLVKPVPGDGPLPLASGFDKASLAFGLDESFVLVAQSPGSIVFRATGLDVEVEKAFTFAKGEYVLGLTVTVRNVSGAKVSGRPIITWVEQVTHQASSGSWLAPSGPEDVHLPTCLVNDKVEKAEAPKKEDAFHGAHEGRVMWAGADSRYFLAAVIPQTSGRAGCDLAIDARGAQSATVSLPAFDLDPGKTVAFSYRVFAGPKDYGLLEGIKSGLDRSVDYGWLSILCVPMLWLLRLFFSLIGNYGVAIILLTILVKILSLPLTNKSYKSMQAMAKLKPKMDELNKKYKDDKQKLNEEMMKLYQQHGISPLSGCLPMLLQMPIWIALYRMLYSAVELYQAGFIPGWLDNLAEKDPTYILPILLGAGMFLQQKITPSTMDSAQAKMMLYFMPIFFTFIMLSLPSGLTLYIFVNTLLSLGQQVYNNRQARPSAAAAAPVS